MAYFKLIPDDKVVLKKLAELQDRSADPHKDRKSVVQGKSVDLGGRRIIKKKKKEKIKTEAKNH